MFGDNMKLSRIPEVTQEHCRLCLIINLVFQPDEGMPSVNDTTEREVSPESMQFERAFPRILQAIWEADPDKGSVQVSNMDMKDAYHHGMLRPSQVRDFAYIISSISDNDCIIICINLVLPMVWVGSPNYFCAFSETLTDVSNALVNKSLPVPKYGEISKIPKTGPGPP